MNEWSKTQIAPNYNDWVSKNITESKSGYKSGPADSKQWLN